MSAEPTVTPTKERLRHAGDDVESFTPAENVNHSTLRMLDGSPLEKLATLGEKNPRKGITGEQYQAGARYFADAYYSGILASGVVDPERERVDGGEFKDITDHRLAAQTRFNRACKGIGHVHRNVLDDLVLAECPLNIYAERFKGHYSRHRDRMVAALTTLRNALDALDIHYNGQRREAYKHSHRGDYRPAIMSLAEGGD